MSALTLRGVRVMSDIEREEFEQAVTDRWSNSYSFTRFGDEDYCDEVLEGMWRGWQASREALEGVTGAGDGGQHIDDIAVDRFAEAMKQKLAKQRQKGYGGWNDKDLCPDGRLQKYLGACLGKGDPVDIGNFAMMIWNRGESVTDAGVPDADYIRALQDALDIIQADANTEENYDSLRRIGSVLANIKAKQEQGQ